MKKTIATFVTMLCAFVFVLIFAACGSNSEYVGVYKMKSISGIITQNGQTVHLTTDLYEYYNITLNEDGTGKIESKGTTNTNRVESTGTWDVENGKVLFKSKVGAITVVEEMTWENGVLTYVAEQTGVGYAYSMTIVLERETQAK